MSDTSLDTPRVDDMSNTPYRIATTKEKEAHNVSENYDLLIGPDGFKDFLGEREARSWSRDGRKVVAELNRLHDLLDLANAIIAGAKEYVEEFKEFPIDDGLWRILNGVKFNAEI